MTTPARERTRHEIVRQAMGLFQERGFGAVSLQDIATAAGCSKATVLYHFAGKTAVLAAVLEPAAADLARVVATARDMSRDAAQEFAITEFIEMAVRYRGVMDVVQEVIPVIYEIPEIAQLVADGIQLQRLLAGSDDPLELGLAGFALSGLMGECRHPGEHTEAELRRLGDVGLRRLLRPS
ncbi:TetR/AcrR family transcriptional regulator [Kribbella sandramycini]|uniref:AcrR family transcriptional regulator n=1 Tax=Kribbella sandramycini TaxID=60450 RepID=A0A7Y4KZC4_9ACTN|nr:TetR/AcrR family transcriptional regulator [Kribbella sandramycini]MBB6569535.1 AcrR family transcriptional regulator [Kribbella sandramycini]NOL40631.1 TetR/AcrR family transcriptional regulator [Kribbella sandramycini]